MTRSIDFEIPDAQRPRFYNYILHNPTNAIRETCIFVVVVVLFRIVVIIAKFILYKNYLLV